MKDSFKSVIILDSYPRSQIDLHICVLENDGSTSFSVYLFSFLGYLSASFNAATLALIDAGMETKIICIIILAQE
jgi:ribonuclease PH